MKKIRIFFAAMVMLALSVSALAQNITVKGTVKDTSGEGIVGASVVLKGDTKVYTMTSLSGAFTLSVPADGVLEVNCMGFQGVEVPVNGRTTLSIVLEDDSQLLDETIVVAYGTATRSSFTGSASTMKAETIEKRQASNITQTLSGAVSGVQTMSSNGQPGTGATVRIRGFGSINAGMSPLYVVDGVPYDGDISAINTQDIESMTVLKDAASAALYGARGANGVILITTKRGKVAEAVVNFEGRYGVNSRAVKNYNVLTQTETYMEKLYEAYYNAGKYNLGYNDYNAYAYANGKFPGNLGYQIYTVPDGQNLFGQNGKLNPNATLGYAEGDNYYIPDDWAAETFHPQTRQEYNLSVSGGSDKLNYYMSAGYLSDGGVIVGSGFDRLTTRASVDYQAKKWLKVGSNLGYTNYTSRYPGEQQTTNSSGNAFFIANYIAPVYPIYVRKPIYDESGKFLRADIVTDKGNKIFDWGDGSSTPKTRNWMSISNPLGDLTYQVQEYQSDILNGKWYGTILPFEGFSVTGTVAVMIDNTRYHDTGNSLYGQSAAYGGTAYQDYTRSRSLTKQLLANYHKSIGKNNIDLTAVYEGYEYNTENVWASSQNLYRNGIWAVNNGIDQKRGGGSTSQYATEGYIGRINVDHGETIFLSGSFRRDASSRFAPEHRWGNFWSVSGAWVLNKESWFKSDIVDLFKIKASYGQQGNDNIGNLYAYLDQYSMTGADGIFSDANLAYKGNPDLTWETTNAFNVGVDFDLYDRKISGSFEYFNRTADDMLYNKPVAASNGYSSIPMNIGSLENKGWELELNWNLINTKNISWDVFGNITYIKNTILKLAPELNGELISGSTIYQEGKSRYQMYLVKYAGVDPQTGQALYWTKETQKNDAGQDIEVEVKTADYTTASSTNRQPTGDLAAPYYGGFGTSLNFFGLDFSVQFAYQKGGRLYDDGYAQLMHGGTSGDAGQNWHVDILKSWQKPGDVTDVPRVDNADLYADSISDRWLVSSDYLSLNNVTIGYTLPAFVTKKMNVASARIYVSGDNLYVLSARQGLDPRQGVTSATTALYTALRTVSGGVKLTF